MSLKSRKIGCNLDQSPLLADSPQLKYRGMKSAHSKSVHHCVRQFAEGVGRTVTARIAAYRLNACCLSALPCGRPSVCPSRDLADVLICVAPRPHARSQANTHDWIAWRTTADVCKCHTA